MFRFAGNFLTITALVFMCGMHFAVLQLIAAAQMVVAYSEGSTLTAAIAATVGGQRPCALCKKIRKGRAEEKKKNVAIGHSEKKGEIFLTSDALIRVPSPSAILSYAEYHVVSAFRTDCPLLPPPRRV